MSSSYRVEGVIGYMFEYSYNEDSVWEGKNLQVSIVAENDEEAKEKAKEIVEEFIKKNASLHPDMHRFEDDKEPKMSFRLTKTLWALEWEKGHAGRSAVPAVPEVPSQIVER